METKNALKPKGFYIDKRTMLMAFLILGRVLMAVLGGFIAWAAIEIAVVFWQTRGSLHGPQWMVVFVGAIQAGLCWLMLQGMQHLTRALRSSIADSAKNEVVKKK